MAPTVQFPATIKEYWEKGILQIRTSCDRHLLIIPDEAKIQEAYKKSDNTSDNNAFCAFKKQLCEYGFKIVGRKDWAQLEVPSNYMWVYEHEFYNHENMLNCKLQKPMKKIAIRFLMNPETYEVEWQNCPKTVQFADRIIDCVQQCASNYAGKKAMHRSGAYKNSMVAPYFRGHEDVIALHGQHAMLMNLDEDDEPPMKRSSNGHHILHAGLAPSFQRAGVKRLQIPPLAPQMQQHITHQVSLTNGAGYSMHASQSPSIVSSPPEPTRLSPSSQQQLIEQLLQKAHLRNPAHLSSPLIHSAKRESALGSHSRSSSSESITMSNISDKAKEALRRAVLLNSASNSNATGHPLEINPAQVQLPVTPNAPPNGANSDLISAISLSRQIKREAGEGHGIGGPPQQLSPQIITTTAANISLLTQQGALITHTTDGPTVMQLVPMIVKSSALKNSGAKWITADKLTAEGVSIDLQQ